MIAQVNSVEQRFRISILANDECDGKVDNIKEYIMDVKFSKTEEDMMIISIFPEATIEEEPEQMMKHIIQWRNKKS